MTMERLKQLEGEMQKCFRCSLCKMVPLPVYNEPRFADCCPANHEYQFHGYSGSGKSIMGLSLVDGRIEPDNDLAEVTFACTTCGYCDVACKFIMAAERQKVNMALREHLVEEGYGLPILLEQMKTLRRDGCLDGKETRQRLEKISDEGLKKLPEASADVLLYSGCIDDQSLETTLKLARLLQQAGIKTGTMGTAEPNTGLDAYFAGDRELFTDMARKWTDTIDSLGVKTVVILSGSDLGVVRAKFPEYAGPPKTRVLHATEFLSRLIARKKLTLSKPVVRTVTYHDPCYLGRQSEPPVIWEGEEKVTHGCMPYSDPPRSLNYGTNGVYEAPRKILRAIPGLTLVEMHRIREYAFCCGGGGGVPSAYPDLARNTARHRLAEVRDVGAECLVTACSRCIQNLTAAQQYDPNALPVCDVIDLVFESAGLMQ